MLKMKFCGLRRLADVDAVNEIRPDYVGFVFAKSKRQVTKQDAVILRSALSSHIRSVGVFVNETVQTIEEIVNFTGIEIVQLHGDETEAMAEKLRRILPGKLIWRAVALGAPNTETLLQSFPADLLLLDAFSNEERGGTGRRIQMDDLTKYAPLIRRPFLLAGGITPQNATEVWNALGASLQTHCLGFDVSSGIERNGWKEKESMRQMAFSVRSIKKEVQCE